MQQKLEQQAERSTANGNIPNSTNARRASSLRRRMHLAAVAGDAGGLDDAMTALYDDVQSPLVVHDGGGRVGRPETFAPIVEACALCIVCKHNALANDMLANVEFMHRGFGIASEEYAIIHPALMCCAHMDVARAATALSAALVGTSLEGRVKVDRHTRKADK